ncbi:hypothetical protein M0804_014186 [Polistes exclamans]|nr:hypothetical protein M0804_014190 [Polistes exclamans]KAI4475637.1 hypothetical protein M0804_014186 [Polistes exclamans]
MMIRIQHSVSIQQQQHHHDHHHRGSYSRKQEAADLFRQCQKVARRKTCENEGSEWEWGGKGEGEGKRFVFRDHYVYMSICSVIYMCVCVYDTATIIATMTSDLFELEQVDGKDGNE